MTDADKDKVELAIRRTTAKLREQPPWNADIDRALTALADELAGMHDRRGTHNY